MSSDELSVASMSDAHPLIGVPPIAVEQSLSVIEASKRLAAYTAVDQNVKPEHRVRIIRIDVNCSFISSITR